MSSDHPEPAPPLEPEDHALETSLHALRPRTVAPIFLDHLLNHLELVVSDELAASSPDSPPMPLDASLLAFEHELRSLRPVDFDFPTGQRVLTALQQEMNATSPAAAAFSALPGLQRPASRTRWSSPAMPWAAAAALVAASWIALPYLPRAGGGMARANDSGLIPFASRSGEKGSVALVFPVQPQNQIFGTPGGQPVNAERNPGSPLRSFSIPEATSQYGLLGVDSFNLPPEYCEKVGIAQGVGVLYVVNGGPAWTHGVEAGDIILRINGAPVSAVDELAVMVKNSVPGTTMTLRVLRGRAVMDISVRLGSAPSA